MRWKVVRIFVLDGSLKCGFCKKLLLHECNSDQLPTFFHSVITFGWVCCCFTVASTQKWWQNKKKWVTGQSCIRKEVTSYWIHTLGKGQLISKCLFGVFNSSKTRTKTIRLEVTRSNFFCSFFGRIEDTKKTLWN